MVRKDKNTFLHLQQAIHYVQHGTYAESVTPEEKSGIRKLAASFVVDGRFWTSLSHYFNSGLLIFYTNKKQQ